MPPTDLEWLSQHTRHKADEIEEMYVGFQVRIMIMVMMGMMMTAFRMTSPAA